MSSLSANDFATRGAATRLTGYVLILLLTCSCAGYDRTSSRSTRSTSRDSALGAEQRLSSGHQTRQAPAPEQQPPAASPLSAEDQAAARDLRQTQLTLITERIRVYEQKIEAWQEVNSQQGPALQAQPDTTQLLECRKQLTRMLYDYNQLQEVLQQNEGGGPGEVTGCGLVSKMLSRDIAFLESGCNRLLPLPREGEEAAAAAASEEKAREAVRESEQHIAQALAGENYQAVIETFVRTPGANEKFSPETLFAYGVALMKSRREQEASKTFTAMRSRLTEAQRPQWEAELVPLLGDLHFALNDYATARQYYREAAQLPGQLAEKSDWIRLQLAALDDQAGTQGPLPVYAALLRGYLNFTAARDGFALSEQAASFSEKYPNSPVRPIAQHILTQSREEAGKWFNKISSDISRLTSEKNYQQAQALLDSIPAAKLSGEKQTLLEEKRAEIATFAPSAVAPQSQGQDQMAQEQWDNGLAALKAKEYDRAIEIFTALSASPLADKATERAREAAQLAAQEGHKKAAGLFVRAHKTADQENRKKLLFASYRVLKAILIKYPDTTVTEKVNKHLQIIENEITAIDPALLSDPALGENSPPTPPAAEPASAAPDL